VNLEYFEKNGYTPYGCDVVGSVIKQCKKRLPKYSENFHVNQSVPNLKDYFSEEFDVIFSNQTLYYLNDNDISNIVSQFYNMLKPGGVFFATMIAPENYMNNPIPPSSVERFEGGLTKCTLKAELMILHMLTSKLKKRC